MQTGTAARPPAAFSHEKFPSGHIYKRIPESTCAFGDSLIYVAGYASRSVQCRRRYLVVILAIVAIMVAILARPVPTESHCAKLFPVLFGLLGTTISQPGSGLADLPALATMPFIYIMYVWLFFELEAVTAGLVNIILHIFACMVWNNIG